jgi:hypothetical protein
VDAATARLKKEAQADLAQKIQVKISNAEALVSGSRIMNATEDIAQLYVSVTTTESVMEMVGMKTESYYDKRHKTLYAFVYAERREAATYYKKSIALLLQQAEAALQSAEQLERNAIKAKARQQCIKAKEHLAQTEAAQGVLAALDGNVADEDLQHERSQELQTAAVQVWARLEQGIYVYIESNEDIIVYKVSAALAESGCSFTDEEEQADFALLINAVAEPMGKPATIVFCMATVAVKLIDCRTQKNVYSNKFSQKGGGTSYDNAGRKAFETVANEVSDKIINHINN